MDRGVLGENRDPALALEFVAVHGAFSNAFVGAERATLVQQGVDQRGFAVVDVGDDGDVTSERIGDRHLTSIRGTDALRVLGTDGARCLGTDVSKCWALTIQGAEN